MGVGFDPGLPVSDLEAKQMIKVTEMTRIVLDERVKVW